MRTILTILCLAAWFEASCVEVASARIHGLPIKTDDATGIAVIPRYVLSELTKSEPTYAYIDLRKDPLAVTTPLPIDRDTLVVINSRGSLTPMVWTRARQIADLGYRRVRILWNVGC